jgi:hypothetical protein
MSDKPCYTIDNFPFDLLRVGGNDEKGYKPNDFGSAHQLTFVEVEPGIYKEYNIRRPPMLAPSITYWVNKKGDPKKPNLYHHLPLYPKWGEKNSKGEVSRTTNKTGDKMMEFTVKFKNAIIRELKKLPDNDRRTIMGYKVANSTEWIDDIAQHPLYEEGHKYANQPNTDKSPSIATAIWLQDTSKNEKDDKKSGGKKKKSNSDVLKIPDTQTIIFAKFFWSPNPIPTEEEKEPLMEYSKIKRFIYNSENHPNASHVIADTVSSGQFLTPCILWKPKEGHIGKVQFKQSEIVFTVCNPRSYSRALTDERIQEINDERASALEEFGIVQQVDVINDYGKTSASAAGLSPITNDNAPRKKIEFRTNSGNSGDSEISEEDQPTSDPAEGIDDDLIRENERIGLECLDQ